ncbi:MAG: adenylate/guanylate cyclase domain-containing protein [Mesorhizobium sp.]|uniref:adenylate/guanylate cyclase domain-containing protein n=1 Tax=unclassified Mesorhizobium TaxID=325217 RepID=UPI000FD563BA|nr:MULTISPECIES: adenylate/guanylate cyclase domain-containing protein [unclassified Mesorhizobium]RUV04527.1 adenylate/guanylate cyclase domain-containing protein [Mesorhizobium sp. M6A.T.Cr.TU.017.01.1.1]RWQ35126.1 MAG: adenylate/guanylate cyclase domain-containing protein [Mesorhizobium sp.]TIL27044.1 MAG: adenylate/guanylate cyclase domain-containing protein [Mesorhizobium sp.]
MAEERVQRRLAAILAADVVGYSRLMERDEAGTLVAIKSRRKDILQPLLAKHNGRIVKLMGDGVLVEFASAVNAVQCAVELQNAMAAANADVPEDSRIVLRVGINLGDVMVEGSDLYGDGVNIAARLEALADAGSIVVSRTVFNHVRGKVKLGFDDLGEQQLKNIAERVRIYRLRPDREAAMARPALALPDKPSIAVLPFTNMSGDPEQEYFSDGMVEDIIAALSRVRSFFVIARNSSFAYKGKAVNVKQVGLELGVRYVLEGSVRKAGNRVRITGQLIEAESGNHVWADRFDGSLEDVFELQDGVTQSVVGAIAPKLQRAEIDRTSRKRTEDLTAYDFVLRALPHAWSGSPERSAIAHDLLLKATAIDPSYAYAYAMAAWSLMFSKNSGWRSWRPDQQELCVRFAREALKLDMEDPAVLWASATALASVVHEHEHALELIERSLAIDHNSAQAWAAKGWVTSWIGLDGIPSLERAMRLSPFDPLLYLFHASIAECHLAARRHEMALEWSLRAMREHPEPPPFVRRVLAASYARLGLVEEARRVVAGILAESPSFTVRSWLEITAQRGPHVQYLAESLRLAGLPQ